MILTERWRDGLAQTRRMNRLNGVNGSGWPAWAEQLLVSSCFVSRVDGPRPFGFYPSPDDTPVHGEDRTTR
jgi:hypothetical protein